MCGRYLFTLEGDETLRAIGWEIFRRYGEAAWTPGEIFPGSSAPILIAEGRSIRAELFSWGFPLEKSLLINARAETAAEKPMFRESVAARRCVIPATGFFEWDGEKRKFLFTFPDNTALYMAGLYTERDGKRRYCILTTQANDSIREVHHRMPLVLSPRQMGAWLFQPERSKEILRQTPPELGKEDQSVQLSLW